MLHSITHSHTQRHHFTLRLSLPADTLSVLCLILYCIQYGLFLQPNFLNYKFSQLPNIHIWRIILCQRSKNLHRFFVFLPTFSVCLSVYKEKFQIQTINSSDLPKITQLLLTQKLYNSIHITSSRILRVFAISSHLIAHIQIQYIDIYREQ